MDLPAAAVLRLIREGLPPTAGVNAAAKAALARAASIFALYVADACVSSAQI
jgi:histone H3/H4